LIISKIYIYFEGTTFEKGKIIFLENIKVEFSLLFFNMETLKIKKLSNH